MSNLAHFSVHSRDTHRVGVAVFREMANVRFSSVVFWVHDVIIDTTLIFCFI